MKTIVEIIPESNVDATPERFNTACHRLSEHPAHVEESERSFDLNATTFDKWLPLILKSRGLDAEGETHTIVIPRWLVIELMAVAKTYKASGSIMKASLAEFKKERPFCDLSFLNNENGWFCRADDVSGKDGLGSDIPLRNLDQLLTLLVTSWRLHGAYARSNDSPFRLHFLPWDHKADTRTEFRIFVAPTLEDDASFKKARVTAISQYSWWQPILPEMEAKIHEIAEAAKNMLNEIKMQPTALCEPLRQGFTFDLQCRDDNVQLIELNGFGALQATGACLFNWVTDRHILYDEDDDAEGTIVFRICK